MQPSLAQPSLAQSSPVRPNPAQSSTASPPQSSQFILDLACEKSNLVLLAKHSPAKTSLVYSSPAKPSPIHPSQSATIQPMYPTLYCWPSPVRPTKPSTAQLSPSPFLDEAQPRPALPSLVMSTQSRIGLAQINPAPCVVPQSLAQSISGHHLRKS